MTVSAAIFLGPSLKRSAARKVLDAVYLPPAAQGDLYRVAAEQRPAVIGIIDGYFQSVPAIWHKEILWAMSQGIHVFGSSSMGALRAAELHEFGMEGIGWVFAGFNAGLFQDDDEVAVAHQDENGEPPFGLLSDAMVNIRRSLEAASVARVISRETEATLIAIGKSMFYADRTYRNILQLGRQSGLPVSELTSLSGWLVSGRIDQKRRDALDLLSAIDSRLADGLTPKMVSFHFQSTPLFARVVQEAGTSPAPTEARACAMAKDVLDELRLAGGFFTVLRDALGRALALREYRPNFPSQHEELISAAVENFRRQRKLSSYKDVSGWSADNDLTEGDLVRLLYDEAVMVWAAEMNRSELDRYVLDELRVSDAFSGLRARAVSKRRICDREPTIDDPTMLLAQGDVLARWFMSVENAETDIVAELLAERLGFDDELDLVRALNRERQYRASLSPQRATVDSDSTESER